RRGHVLSWRAAPSQLRQGLAQRLDFEGIEMGGNSRRDEARRDGRAVVMEHRYEAGRVDRALVDNQHAHLGVAVLLDHEDLLVLEDEVDHLLAEREGTDAQSVE